MTSFNNEAFENLISAIGDDDIAKVEALLVSGLDPNVMNGGRFSLLHTAAWNGKKEITKILINAGADVDARDSITGKTPIFNACSYEIIKDLIDAGADVNIKDTHDQNTVLHNNVFHKDCLSLFIDAGFDLNIINRMGWNVLHMHTAYGNYWHVEKLLDYGMDPVVENFNGKTAMDIAMFFEQNECFRVLERYHLKSVVKTKKSRNLDVGIGL